MILVLFSDKGYEKMVDSFLISRKYSNNEDITVLYYSVGFDSELDYPNLIKKRWEIWDANNVPDGMLNNGILNLAYYKPEILLDALSFSDKVCFMDSDVLLSKRFSIDSVVNNDYDYPLCCRGPVEHVWVWEVFGDGITHVYNEQKLMDYFGVKDRGIYVWSSMISVNEKCRDFLEEWDSIIKNKYLSSKSKYFFPFRDETSLNVLFWKRGNNNTLGLIFFNTIKFESFLKVENLDDFQKHVREYHIIPTNYDIYETCEDSSAVNFYHGMKPGPELDKTIEWMQKNSIY